MKTGGVKEVSVDKAGAGMDPHGKFIFHEDPLIEKLALK